MAPRSEIEKYARERFGHPSGGLSHTERVYKLALRLSEDYDDEILHAACFLHDINLDKPHPKKAAEEAKKVLSECGFPKEKRDAVIHAIDEHGFYGNPDSKEAFMLFDADQMDSMGLTGFIQFSEFDSDPAEIDNILKKIEMEAHSILRLSKSKKIALKKIEDRKAIIAMMKEELGI